MVSLLIAIILSIGSIWLAKIIIYKFIELVFKFIIHIFKAFSNMILFVISKIIIYIATIGKKFLCFLPEFIKLGIYGLLFYSIAIICYSIWNDTTVITVYYSSTLEKMNIITVWYNQTTQTLNIVFAILSYVFYALIYVTKLLWSVIRFII